MPSEQSPVFLMCPPEHFAIVPHPVCGHANDRSVAGEHEYRNDPAAFRRRANKKWEAFKVILERELGASVITLDPLKGLNDQVFAADASISLVHSGQPGNSFLSRFTYEERQPEVEIQANALRRFDPHRVLTESEFNIEGCGDNVYDAYRDLFWSGCTAMPNRMTAGTGRSDARSHRQLAAITGVEAIDLEVRRPFFHLDTAVGILPAGHVMCCRDGLSQSAYESLLGRAFEPYGLDPNDYLIKVSREDADRYACNIVAHGNAVVLPEVSPELKNTLRAKGYTPITTNLDEFILAGGGPHCLTNRVNERRVPGGTARASHPGAPEARATS